MSYTLGFNTLTQIYSITLILDLFSIITLILASFHHMISLTFSQSREHVHTYYLSIHIQSTLYQEMITYHIASPSLHISSHTIILLSLTLGLWSTHLINIQCVAPGHSYPLSFAGGVKSNTASLILSDISHHHSSLPIHLPTWSSIALSIPTILTLIPFYHHHPHSSIALSPSLFTYSITPSTTSQHLHSLSSFSGLSYDLITSSTTYIHHSWIASITILASSSHLSIYLTRDYTYHLDSSTPISILLADKSSVLSSITYISIYLGCHTLGIYIHNDTCISLSHLTPSLSLDPILSQLIQELLGKHLSNTSSTPSHLPSFNKSLLSLIFTINPGDLYTHHSIALGLHITTLVLLKGCLDSRFTYHHPDKTHQHYAFSCDGPSRGGTCDTSSWDSFYLSSFWILNTLAWITFYFHWKHLTLYGSSPSLFDSSSTYLNGWFRDYLWFNSSSLIQGYNTHGANDLSTWSWIFLGAHLVFATGFMFLISQHGYWQELLDILMYMHLKTPILYNLWNGGMYTPVALSIIQARFIGLLHFSVGFSLTYPPFVICATS